MDTRTPETYGDAISRIERRIEDACGGPVNFSYSAYDLDENGVPIDNLDTVPLEGTFVIHIGGDPGLTEPLTNPTWLELCKYADRCVTQNGVGDHVYLETINIYGRAVNSDGHLAAYFNFGS